MPLSAEEKRRRRALARYAQTKAGTYVRASAFRECDFCEDDSLRQFWSEAEVLAFEAERYCDGTGNRVKFWSAPRSAVPEGQLALRDHLKHTVCDEGNTVRVQLEAAEERLHARLNDLDDRMGRLLAYHDQEPPPSQMGELKLMALLQRTVPVQAMDACLAEHCGARPSRGMFKSEKAAILVRELPRAKLDKLLAREEHASAVRPPPVKRMRTTQSLPMKQTLLDGFKKPVAGADGSDSVASTSADTGAPASPSSAPSLPAETGTETSFSDEGILWL